MKFETDYIEKLAKTTWKKSNNTVEYRLKNNSPVRNNRELDMIHAISKIIRTNLTK